MLEASSDLLALSRARVLRLRRTRSALGNDSLRGEVVGFDGWSGHGLRGGRPGLCPGNVTATAKADEVIIELRLVAEGHRAALAADVAPASSLQPRPLRFLARWLVADDPL